MGQFKPMVKMMTTEPSIELKLKKGGKVEKKMQMGGAPMSSVAPARGGAMPAANPMRPSMAARRRAMMAMPAGAAPAAPVGMAGRMMKEGGESKAEHKAEMAKMAKTAKALKEHADKPASKAHKGLKTGGVVMGQAGYKKGGAVVPKSGIINTEGQGGVYRNTLVHTAKPDTSPAKTGEVKMGNDGGFATGGVAKANAGGYKKGGAAKKAYATGGVVNSGAPVAMPQGRKKPSAPVSITQLSGTFKKGGKVTAAEGRLQKNFEKENATAMKQAKAYSNEVYSKYGKKMADGGVPSEAKAQIQKDANERALKEWEKSQREETQATKDFLPNMARRAVEGFKGLFSKPAPEGSVTKTKESVTVTPAKKRSGGRVC